MVVSKPRRVERDRNTNTRKEKDKSRETQWYLERLREATRIARDRKLVIDRNRQRDEDSKRQTDR